MSVKKYRGAKTFNFSDRALKIAADKYCSLLEEGSHSGEVSEFSSEMGINISWLRTLADRFYPGRRMAAMEANERVYRGKISWL